MGNLQSIAKKTNISIDKNSNLSDAIDLIYKNHEGAVIVLDHNRIVGIMTERDVIELLDKHIDLDQPVINVAGKKVIAINVNRTIEYALHILVDNNIRRLSVIDDDGTFIGLLTQKILVNQLEEEHYRVNLRISQVLSNTQKNIITLPILSAIKDAVSKMSSTKIGAILLSDDTEIVGIITESDIVRCVSKSISMNSTIDKVMTSPVTSVNMNDIVHNVANMMQEKDIQRVLVKDENGRAIGLIEMSDIIKNIKGNYEHFIENKLKYTKHALNTIDEVIFELYINKNITSIQWGNHSALQQYGHEIIDKPIETLIDADIWSGILQILSEKGEIHDHKIKIKSKYYLISCNHYETIICEQLFLLVCKDVTKYENYLAYEKKISMGRERMELALLGSNDGIWDWNILDNSVYFSPRWKEMLGYRDDELTNELSTWEDRLHPDDRDKTWADIHKNVNGETKYFEDTHRLKHKDGHWVWIHARGKTLYNVHEKAVRMIGTHTDITEEKELQLKYSHQAQIIEQIHESVISTDLNGYITSWNMGAEKLLGYKANEIIGKPITLLYLEEDYRPLEVHFDKLMQKGEYQAEVRLVKKSKDIIFADLSLSMLKDEKENLIGMIGYSRDITARKKAQNKIKHLNDNLKYEIDHQLKQIREKDKQLLQQCRMAQMGEMIAMIAHQWRQPLSAIASTSASIELKASLNKLDNDMAQQKAQDISAFSQHLSKTIDDFRNFFKPNKEKEETSYDELIASILEIIGISIRNQDIELIQELHYHEKFISYPSELKQVILNLIKNAEDALLENEIEKPYIKISTYKENDNYILEVKDNAGGIPEEVMGNIFDPYFSTKTEKEGTGLGLYMSKMIIKEHCKGELSVSNDTEGAVFKVVFKTIEGER